MEELFARLLAAGPAAFRYGISRTPTLSAGTCTAVGVIDPNQDRVRMVTVGLPADFLRSLPAHSRNPFRRVALAGFRAFFNRLAKVREVRYEDGRAWMREAPSDDWSEAPGGPSDGRPSINNPAWIVGLLRAPAASVTTRTEAAGAAGRELHLTLDLSVVERGLPSPLSEQLGGAEREHLIRTPMQISISEAGLPERLAVSTGPYTDTGEPGWSVLELTSYGCAFDRVDLWRDWQAVVSELAAP